ncbi:Uncharacterised protein [Enterobacter hormaechei]|uniref:Uncharacterized protein n=1 Tax=Enterobacter hormaechei TaxID=158836 RepID=A0A822X3W7_9ENTR|nr:hypothetical protein CSB67_4879 [Enterobacter hormaechei]EUM56862.1 hypothetical protein L361_00026 [Enterobacter sp. MGH 15]EUM85245.1 hypothetical protein L356_05322 [Enterobacter sp. MGH 10]EUM88427.1 hypothetical protein L352_07713 [Enterobacter sp. MGH 6]EUN08464.1 hypothetical protein L347_07139 [Enterobacter sp. MGH 1]KLW66076.1 hypothetical protein SK57_02469 [Enterobacter sp. BIDMC87]CAA2944996.1 Uncharacterised protein [Enterobacter cloacae]
MNNNPERPECTIFGPAWGSKSAVWRAEMRAIAQSSWSQDIMNGL